MIIAAVLQTNDIVQQKVETLRKITEIIINA
jgi:hypothetical protein